MVFWDNIAKKAKETAAAASKAYEDASKSIKEKTIGELVDSAIDTGSKVVSHLSESVLPNAEYHKKNDIDNYTKKLRTSSSKEFSYCQKTKDKKVGCRKAVKDTTNKSNSYDFLEDILDSIFD